MAAEVASLESRRGSHSLNNIKEKKKKKRLQPLTSSVTNIQLAQVHLAVMKSTLIFAFRYFLLRVLKGS